jgi:hypothetical protein
MTFDKIVDEAIAVGFQHAIRMIKRELDAIKVSFETDKQACSGQLVIELVEKALNRLKSE